MDGHENDADAPNQSGVAPSTPETPADGAIFSSDETRVETENLPEISAVANQAPMSSISPALRTESTVTGDLKLGDAPKKKKWPLIVIATAVAAIIMVIIVLLLPKGQKGIDAVEEKLAAYAGQLNRAPEGVEWNQESNSNYFIKDLVNEAVELGPTQLSSYIESLDGAVAALYNTTEKFYGNSKHETAQYVMDDAKKLIDTNSMLKAFLQIPSTLTALDTVLVQNGIEAALNSVPQYEESIGEDMTAYLVYSSLSGYMAAYLNRNNFFMQNGCYVNGIVVDECMQRLSEANTEIAIEADAVAKNFLQARNYFYQAGNVIYDALYQYIDEMQTDLEGVK